MSDSKYNAVFKWPSTSANHVIVTGTFDNWSRSVTMSKTDGGFEASVPVPWDSEVIFKFIVDGTWIIDHQLQQRYDNRGQVNNVMKTPKAPEPAATPEPELEVTAAPEPEPEVTAAPEPEPEVTAVPEPEATVVPEPEPAVPAAAPVTPEHEPLPVAEDDKAPEPEPAPVWTEIKARDMVDTAETAPVVASSPQVVVLATEVEHATDIVPEAMTSGPAHEEDIEPASMPVVELLPSQDALPETAPVDTAATVGDVAAPAPAADEPSPEPPVEAPAPEPAKDTEATPAPTPANKPAELTEKPAEAAPTAQAKPRLEGKGSVNGKGNGDRRSRTMSGFGSIRHRLFPSTDEKHNGTLAARKSLDGATPPSPTAPRGKRKSFIGRITGVFKP